MSEIKYDESTLLLIFGVIKKKTEKNIILYLIQAPVIKKIG